MSTFNNQWILGRGRARHREAGEAERTSASPEGAGRRAVTEPRVPRIGSVPRHPRRAPGFGPAVAGSTMRKHPRWVDRDT